MVAPVIGQMPCVGCGVPVDQRKGLDRKKRCLDCQRKVRAARGQRSYAKRKPAVASGPCLLPGCAATVSWIGNRVKKYCCVGHQRKHWRAMNVHEKGPTANRGASPVQS